MCHSHGAVDILFRDIRGLSEQSNYGVSGHIDLLIFIPYSFFAGKLNDFWQLIHSFLPHMVMVTRQSITSPGYFCKVSESMSLNNRDEAVLQASKGFESCATN